MEMVRRAALALLRDESGQDLVEYVLILMLIAVASIAVMATFGEGMNQAYDGAADEVGNAVSS